MKKGLFFGSLAIGSLAPLVTFATGRLTAVDVGHLDWMLVASVLVIFMTMPGLALFYSGLAERKNSLSLVMQCMILSALTSLLWIGIGFSLTFGGANLWIGDFSNSFLSQFVLFGAGDSAKKVVYVLFEMGFAIITVAIITGGVIGRMKLISLLLFAFLWQIIAYYPIAHSVWSNGWLQQLGVLDYAGGSVVHINAGVASLVAAIMVGRRQAFSKHELYAHNHMFVILGTAILWFGWFGFNAGNTMYFIHAPSVAIVTQMSACSAVLVWALLGWIVNGRTPISGICSGALVGLVAITPAAGYVGLPGAIAIGAASSAACFFLIRLKHHLGYDDTLDAFGIHGIGGIIGSLLTGVFFAKTLGGRGHVGFTLGNQLWVQFVGVVATIVWSGLVSFVVLYLLKQTVGLRVKPETERLGLDRVHLGEEQA
jgi:Amt family ammonium transporter